VFKKILVKIRELISFSQSKVLWTQLINLKLKGYITIDGKITTEGDLEKIVYDKFLEKKKEIYRRKIKDIFMSALSD